MEAWQEERLATINASRRDLLSPFQRGLADQQHECRVEHASPVACTNMCHGCRQQVLQLLENNPAFPIQEKAA